MKHWARVWVHPTYSKVLYWCNTRKLYGQDFDTPLEPPLPAEVLNFLERLATNNGFPISRMERGADDARARIGDGVFHVRDIEYCLPDVVDPVSDHGIEADRLPVFCRCPEA